MMDREGMCSILATCPQEPEPSSSMYRKSLSWQWYFWLLMDRTLLFCRNLSRNVMLLSFLGCKLPAESNRLVCELGLEKSGCNGFCDRDGDRFRPFAKLMGTFVETKWRGKRLILIAKSMICPFDWLITHRLWVLAWVKDIVHSRRGEKVPGLSDYLKCPDVRCHSFWPNWNAGEKVKGFCRKENPNCPDCWDWVCGRWSCPRLWWGNFVFCCWQSSAIRSIERWFDRWNSNKSTEYFDWVWNSTNHPKSESVLIWVQPIWGRRMIGGWEFLNFR